MASTVDVNILRTLAKRTYEIVTASGSEEEATLVDMKDFNSALFGLLFVSGTGVTQFNVVAASNAAGTTDLTVIKAGTGDLDTAGDYRFVEITDAEVKQVQEDNSITNDLRYVGVQLTATASDVVIVDNELGRAHFEKDQLTVDAVA